jgi:phospholipid transport system substrate-binding protein
MHLSNTIAFLKARSMKNILMGYFLILITIPALADGNQPIEALRKGLNAGFRVLKDPEFSGADRKEAQQQQLRIILEQVFDFRVFSKKVLASDWKKFTPSQRKEFVSVFTEFLGKFYMGKLQKKYKDERLIYVGQEMKSATRARVSIKVVWKGQKIPVDLRMIKRRGLWKVYDIEALGISAVRNYRAQFQSILRKETPGQVIERLKQKIEQIEQKHRGGRRFKFFFANMNKYCYLTSLNAVPVAT